MNTKIKLGMILTTLMLSTFSLLHAKEKIIVRVDGLSCAFCAYGLEKNLKELEGVEKVEINLNDGTASLIFQEGKTVTDETIKKTVKDSGFTPREIKRQQSTKKKAGSLETIELSIVGMSCSGCAYNVKTSLRQVPSVDEVQVDLKRGTATVTVEKGKVSAEKLIEAVEKAGLYKAAVLQNERR